MSAPVLARPKMQAEAVQVKGRITSDPYWCLAVKDEDNLKFRIILQVPIALYDYIEGPEDFFRELADRINKK